MKSKQSAISLWSMSIGVLFWLCCASITHAQVVAPTGETKSKAPPTLLQCTTVTPATKVPWLEESKLPDFTNAFAYFEACSDLDYAWTTQSYPNPQYVPERTPEHQTRVNLLMQGLKDYASAQSDDWVSYVNAWLGIALPTSKARQSSFSNGDVFLSLVSYAKTPVSTRYGFGSETIGVYSTQVTTPSGVAASSERRFSIQGIEAEKLCVTPVDLQMAFENQPGYLLRPMSVRTWRNRPNKEELTKLGGQWFGYEIHVFSGLGSAQSAGLIRVAFAFKPCATGIQVEIRNTP